MGKNTKTVQKKADKKREGTRTRNWSFIVYPESMPSNWIEIIQEERVPFAISPLHDSDIDGDGQLKKAHYHVVICYTAVKTLEQVKELTDNLNAPIPQQCKSLIGSIRYFVHLDNADKFQYKQSEIKAFNGFDLDKCFEISATDRYNAIDEMIAFIVENDITEFSKLFLYARLKNREWFKLLCDNSAYVLDIFIKSRRHQTAIEREQEKELL
jgi:hypothetical protein